MFFPGLVWLGLAPAGLAVAVLYVAFFAGVIMMRVGYIALPRRDSTHPSTRLSSSDGIANGDCAAPASPPTTRLTIPSPRCEPGSDLELNGVHFSPSTAHHVASRPASAWSDHSSSIPTLNQR